ncbi:MAG: Xaa-Pro aminopeptidase [Rhodothermales bacterium]
MQRIRDRVDGPGAVVLTSLPDIRWATGFSGSNALVVLSDQAHLLTDGRYTEQASREVSACQVHIATAGLQRLAVGAIIAEGSEVTLQAEQVTLAQLEEFEAGAEGRRLTFRHQMELVSPLRAIKDALELRAITKAQRLTESVFGLLPSLVREGMTEFELSAEITYRHLSAGAQRMSFDPIVGFGENSALPHGRPGPRRLRAGDPILVDMGCFLDGYASDMTRMMVFGTPTQDFLDGFDLVLRALGQAHDQACAGMRACDLDAAARAVIEEGGMGSAFSHSLGHGVGLEIHEAPSVSFRSEAALPNGCVVTLEPGIYLESQFGIRIEDIVVLRSDGCDLVTDVPRDLVRI